MVEPSSSEALIRSAGVDEAESLAELHVVTWQQAYARLLPNDFLRSLTAGQRLPMWRQILGSPDRLAVFVAECECHPVGFACGGYSNDEDAGPTTGEMWSIYLLQEFWGRGIGKQLHDALLKEFLKRGFTEATLWVMDSNDRTRLWYARQGWTEDGSRKEAEVWGARVLEVRYRKPLAP